LHGSLARLPPGAAGAPLNLSEEQSTELAGIPNSSDSLVDVTGKIYFLDAGVVDEFLESASNS
jgi:hypothetical protein